MSTATQQTYATECRLCHVRDTNPPLEIDGNAKEQPRRVMNFLEKLLKHVGKKHMTELMQGKKLLDQYQSFLLLSQFDTEDPSVQAVIEGMRADIFQRCRKNVPTDEDIALLATRSGFSTGPDVQVGLAALKALRDLCCEIGPHAPKHP